MSKKENLIGPVIKKYRNIKKLSRTKLAEKLGVTPGSIEAYEYGRATPPVKRLKQLHKLLDIPFMEFFPDIEPTINKSLKKKKK
jgi:transcriptional regulator with XRE-family HTH domain